MGATKHHVNKAIAHLEDLKLISIEREHDGPVERRTFSILQPPKWIVDEMEDLKIGQLKPVKESVTGSVTQRRGGSVTDGDGDQKDPRARDQKDPRHGDRKDPRIRKRSRKSLREESVAQGNPLSTTQQRSQEGDQRDGVGQAPPPGEDEVVEVEEDIADGDSVEVRNRQESEKQSRRESKTKSGASGKKARTKSRREPSSRDFRDRPSERWELNAWRGKDSHWRARDFVGYWACRFKEVKGKEDKRMRFAVLSSDSFIRLAANSKRFFDQWLDGSLSRYRQAVDQVLAQVTDPNFVLIFGRPSTDIGLKEALGEVSRGTTRPMSPREKDDARGTDIPFFKRQAAEDRARREASEARAAAQSG